ncbi:MAG: prolyl oligopeptidase family serine peptidase, partial [Conexibacter sp.]
VHADGGGERIVPVPGPGTIGTHAAGVTLPAEPFVAASDGVLSFVYSEVGSAPSVHVHELAEERTEQVLAPAFALPGILTERRWVTSDDGVRLPVNVVRRADLDTTRPHPTLIYAYGGFDVVVWETCAARRILPFVLAGGVYVVPHLRAGGEFGRSWWEAGRFERRQRVYDDLYAVAGELIASGLTTAPQLGVAGESNGGILAAVAIAQRPELFGAAFVGVPLSDLLRYKRDPITYVCANEFGDPDVPAEAAWLVRYSPYHNVRDGVRYPPVLVMAGAHDIRAPAWHARKLAARLQEATEDAGGGPILLEVIADAGHGAGQTVEDEIATAARWVGFVMRHLGCSP